MNEHYSEPNSVIEWIFPFCHDDLKAWENANLLGRILFPVYIVMTFCRTVCYWIFMLAILPFGLVFCITESKFVSYMVTWLERTIVSAFCKRHVGNKEEEC